MQAIVRPVDGHTTQYVAVFTDVFGLRKNADVRVRGVQVGKVEKITLRDDGNANVVFTVLDRERLKADDGLQINFQNLVGQRYVAINRTPESTADQPASQTIPTSRTIGSFDITGLFNGLRPIMRGADPAVLNTFVENILALIQGETPSGENQTGIGSVLRQIDEMSGYVVDQSAFIRAILDNLGVISTQLQGKSEQVTEMIAAINRTFTGLEEYLPPMIDAFTKGFQSLPQITLLTNSLLDLAVGGHDDVRRRMLEVTPDATNLIDAVDVIPATLDSLTRILQNGPTSAQCSKGQLPLPVFDQVIVGGQGVLICRG
ncbi:MCE family protein [Nocardia uniformis]|uniref:MCE family protein n=1 Tax=Nocardia uniformis TaxID=53432 RepID=A0A849BX84_9NOCA|nr:MlaD family protein [Nocardia uniformis]NNH70884.1 MCE family protein [Nocardia uniformis]